MLRITLALLMNIIVPPTASFSSGAQRDGHGESPYQLIVLAGADVEVHGRPLSEQISHSGVQ